MPRFSFILRVREIGALGIFHPIKRTIEAPSLEAAKEEVFNWATRRYEIDTIQSVDQTLREFMELYQEAKGS